MYQMNSWFGFLLEQWQQATLLDYAHLVIGVVLLCWLITRWQ